MKMFVAALTLGTLIATPAFAQSARDAYNAVTPFGSPTATRNQQSAAGTAREAAVHECSVKSRQYSETTWGDMQMHQFRTCMTQHTQPE